jgi:uncharacterized protein
MAGVIVKRTDTGSGVYAERHFERGERVMRVIGSFTAKRSVYTIQIDRAMHIEPYAPAKYLNHSCEPNLGVKMNPLGLPDFYALRDIEPDEHLTYDYAMTEFMLAEMEQQRERVTCTCGADTCRGHLGSYVELPAEIKQRYEGFIADYLLEIDAGRV